MTLVSDTGFSASIGGFAASVHAAVTNSAIKAEIKNNFTFIKLLLSERFENLVSVFCNVHLIKYLRYFSILIDQKRLSVDAHVFLSIHAFFNPDSVFLDDGFVGVRDEIHRQTVFRSKLLMSFLIVNRDAEELYILF